MAWVTPRREMMPDLSNRSTLVVNELAPTRIDGVIRVCIQMRNPGGQKARHKKIVRTEQAEVFTGSRLQTTIEIAEHAHIALTAKKRDAGRGKLLHHGTRPIRRGVVRNYDLQPVDRLIGHGF